MNAESRSNSPEMSRSESEASSVDSRGDAMVAPRRAFLDDLGENYDQSTAMCLGIEDDRERRWKAQNARYGFDSRQTWSLETTMVELLYERLKMFLAEADGMIEMDEELALEHNYSKPIASLRGAIEHLIEIAPPILHFHDVDGEIADEFWRLWAEIHPAMWW